MKNRIVIITFLIPLLLGSCKKDKSPIPQHGEASAILSGQNWKAKAMASVSENYPGKVGVGFEVYNNVGEARESLAFGNIELRTGSDIIVGDTTDSTNRLLNIKPVGFYFRFIDDGDVLSDILPQHFTGIPALATCLRTLFILRREPSGQKFWIDFFLTPHSEWSKKKYLMCIIRNRFSLGLA